MRPTSNSCQRVLVVEDHEASRASLARLLKLNGREVQTASTVDEALEKIHGWQPHCVVLDLWIGNGRGEDVLRQIRGRDLPVRVSIVTGSADAERIASVRTLRPDQVLIKPISFSDLMQWMDSPN
jgi:CheY-like chemotaxis protein